MNGKFGQSDDLSKRKIGWHRIDPKENNDGQSLDPFPMIAMGSKYGHSMF